MIGVLWGRPLFYDPGPSRLVPTLWIVLGPLGQSVTATGLLGLAGAGVISSPYAGALRAIGVVYGMRVWGFVMLWLVVAAAITRRAAREHLPFSLTWWSFRFPVGTVVTGTSVLAVSTDASFLRCASVALYALLLGAWLTAHQGLRGRQPTAGCSGQRLRRPPSH